ncbi:MAG: type II secretion system F family protein [Planctomycetia bacterium]
MASLPTLYRALASLHRAGVGWREALDSVGGALHEPRQRLARGATLPQALTGHVPPLDVALLRAAEASGTYERVLEHLAQRHEEEHRARGKRRAALAYPLTVAHVSALLMPLPDLVRGDLPAAAGWALAALAPIYLFMAYSRRAPRPGRPLPARFPFTARVLEMDGRALAALGALYDAGVPLREALPMAREAGTHGRVARDLARAEAFVAEGAPLAGAWTEVPDDLRVGLASAERAGSLGRECAASAERLALDADLWRQRVLGRSVPLVMLALGLLVAARVISFYAGIFRLAGL